MGRKTLSAVCISAFLGVTGTIAEAGRFFPEGNCVVVAASRPSLPEARSWIEAHAFEHAARVFQSSNGWYAIAIHQLARHQAQRFIQEQIAAGHIPADSYCSTGSQYVREMDWRSVSAAAEPSTDLRAEFDARPLSVADKRFLQAALALSGDYEGLLDGVWGRGSQGSLEAYSRREFGREPTNGDAAYVAYLGVLAAERDGWENVFNEHLAISLVLPMSKMRMTEKDGSSQTWQHVEKGYVVWFSDVRGDQIQGFHDYLTRENPPTGEVYRLRRPNLWITSFRSNLTYYVRSDLIQGTWSTTTVFADYNASNDLKLISASLAPGRTDMFSPSRNGVLSRQVAEIAALVGKEENKPREQVGIAQPPAATKPRVETGDSTGTGFVINSAGVLLTNAHVVEDCQRILVNGRPGQLVASSNIFDLAAVSTEPVPGVEPLAFAPHSIGLNADITIAGYPLHGLLGGLNVSRGTVSSMKGLRGDETNIQISAPVQPGNSGGPVIDRYGNVVGVVVSKLDVLLLADRIGGDIAQNVNFAVRGDIAKVFLSSNGITFAEASSRTPIDAETAARKLQSTTLLIECKR